jgi:hypothetical protein
MSPKREEIIQQYYSQKYDSTLPNDFARFLTKAMQFKQGKALKIRAGVLGRKWGKKPGGLGLPVCTIVQCRPNSFLALKLVHTQVIGHKLLH